MENSEALMRIALALEKIAHSFEIHINTEATRVTDEELEKPDVCDIGDMPEEEVEEDEPDVTEKFLRSRGIRIKTVPPEDAADDVINSLSEFLGKNYSELKDLLKKIKRNMQHGGFIELHLNNRPQKEINNICQFASRLHEIAFLEQYKYFKSPRYLLKAKTTTLPSAQSFFSGKWLERFVLISAQKAVDSVSHNLDRELDFSYLLNPQVTMPNGDDFEFDLIFHIDKSHYWIEAKSGSYQQHISKYSKMSQKLGLDAAHSIMVLADIAPEGSAALGSLFSMTVSSPPQLEELLIEIIEKDIGP